MVNCRDGSTPWGWGALGGANGVHGAPANRNEPKGELGSDDRRASSWATLTKRREEAVAPPLAQLDSAASDHAASRAGPERGTYSPTLLASASAGEAGALLLAMSETAIGSGRRPALPAAQYFCSSAML